MLGERALPLHAAGAVATAELFYLCHGNAVEVALNGVLQRRGRHSKLDGVPAALAAEEGVDQAAAEAVAAAYAVHDLSLIHICFQRIFL